MSKQLPPLPKEITTVLGPVPVAIVDCCIGEGGPGPNPNILGCVDFVTRRVQIRRDLALTAAWAVLEHEWVHLALWDAGVKLDEELEERLCDVIGTALTVRRQAVTHSAGRRRATQ